MRYDQLYDRLVGRAMAHANVDLQFFIQNAVANNVPPNVLRMRLMNDLMNEGPIFGKFMRSMNGAAGQTVLEARRQGTRAAYADKNLSSEMSKNGLNIQQIIDTGDAELLEKVEQISAPLTESTWLCALRNTCDYCLPLHGITRTDQEWDELGLDPSTIHAELGWSSICYCIKVPAEQVNRNAELAPLKRVPLQDRGGSRRTERAITQRDLEKSISAVAKARESVQGRRTMRLLGQANR